MRIEPPDHPLSETLQSIDLPASDAQATSERHLKSFKTLPALLHFLNPIADVYAEIVTSKAIDIHYPVEAKSVEFKVRPECVASPMARKLIAQARLADDQIYGIMELYGVGRLCAEGPKVFRPTVQECQAMEHVEIHIPIELYKQPFPTMAVEFPLDYAKQRSAEGLSPILPGSSSVGFPVAVVLVHGVYDGGPAIVAFLIWDNGATTTKTLFVFNGEHDLEKLFMYERVVVDAGSHMLTKLDETVSDTDLSGLRAYNAMTRPEADVMHQALRIAFNAMLLLSRYGTDKQGPLNPKHHKRLQQFLDKAKKKKGRSEVKETERDLRMLPILYSLNRQVKVFGTHKKEPTERGEAGKTGVTMTPHWRRGHWRNQPCGVGLREEKLVFISPVLINADLLTGQERPGVRVYSSQSANKPKP